MKNHYGCPVQATVNTLRGKWKVMAIWHLGFGAKGFAQLRNLLPGISEKVLTSQLRELEADFILTRTASLDTPPRVTYALTGAGEELIDAMNLLCAWGTRHLGVAPNLPRYPRAK